MHLLRTDIVSILDLRFKGVRQISQLSRISWESEDNSLIVTRLAESFEWLFYGEQLRDFEAFDVSAKSPHITGAILRINRRLGIGTYMLWQKYGADTDALALKNAAWEESNEFLRSLSPYLEGLEVERFYPFVAVMADTEAIDEFATANAVEIGRILTGDLEGERTATLRKYIENDLSQRSYEKLLIRWTEAFALYSRLDSEKKYEECMFRAVQVFEHCILARVSLLAITEQMEKFLHHLLFLTPAKWIKSRSLLTGFSNIEDVFVMYPRVQSVEADRLIGAAHAQFGLEKVLDAAKAKQAELREQLDWAKALSLGLLAFIAYLADKMKDWVLTGEWLATGFHKVFH